MLIRLIVLLLAAIIYANCLPTGYRRLQTVCRTNTALHLGDPLLTGDYSVGLGVSQDRDDLSYPDSNALAAREVGADRPLKKTDLCVFTNCGFGKSLVEVILKVKEEQGFNLKPGDSITVFQGKEWFPAAGFVCVDQVCKLTEGYGVSIECPRWKMNDAFFDGTAVVAIKIRE